MSHKNKLLWLLFVLLLISASVAMVKSYLYWKSTHFSCSGELTLHRKESITNITIQYVFNGDSGMVMLRGEITPTHGPVERVSQNVFFDTQRKGDDHFLVSKSVVDSTGDPTDVALLKRTLPLFYLQSDVKFYLNIKQVSRSSWLFSTSRTPSLLCSSK